MRKLDVDVGLIVKMYKQGSILREIAEKLNVSTIVILHRLDEAGVKRRTHSEAQDNRYKRKPPNNGGWRLHRTGYMTGTLKANLYKLQHRVVMENYLGRKLERWEHVHHINRDRTDNRIENLELLTLRDHYRIHREEDYFNILNILEENKRLRGKLEEKEDKK